MIISIYNAQFTIHNYFFEVNNYQQLKTIFFF